MPGTISRRNPTGTGRKGRGELLGQPRGPHLGRNHAPRHFRRGAGRRPILHQPRDQAGRAARARRVARGPDATAARAADRLRGDRPVGGAIALSYVHKLERLTTGILASSAVLGLVIGLAARQVLANPLAGILLAITQPIRIGDMVTIAEETGRVDDLSLSYTYIDTADGRLVIVPNEQVIASVVVNRS